MVGSTLSVWRTLGDLESFTLASEVDSQEIISPVFVSGLARSGSTILTEIISQHPRFACHHYSDFPITWIPYWWNYLRQRLPLPEQEPQERAHRDRLMITVDSPEAVEEVLWMHFFPKAHNPDCLHVMGEQETHPQFEKFYRDHIRKLLVVRGRQRYLAKNNYHVTRIEYLLKLFPDARIIIPIRDPLQHVASLINQHRLFTQKNTEDSRVSRQLQLSGHYEFGPLRCPIIVDDRRQARYGQGLDETAWYANQWADVYGFLRTRMEENQTLAKACLVVHYDEICSQTKKGLSRLFTHLGIDDEYAEEIISIYAPTVSEPNYYQANFSAQQEDLIRNLTSDVAKNYA